MAYFHRAYFRSLSEHRELATQMLRREARLAPSDEKFDVFLSHSSKDAPMIEGVKNWLVRLGKKVYVDWEVDPVDRPITATNAAVLRVRMSNCANLVYVASSAASHSKWMPWELGYFDGMRQNHVFVLPVVSELGDTFKGQEYLDLYPRIQRGDQNPFIMRTGKRIVLSEAME